MALMRSMSMGYRAFGRCRAGQGGRKPAIFALHRPALGLRLGATALPVALRPQRLAAGRAGAGRGAAGAALPPGA